MEFRVSWRRTSKHMQRRKRLKSTKIDGQAEFFQKYLLTSRIFFRIVIYIYHIANQLLRTASDLSMQLNIDFQRINWVLCLVQQNSITKSTQTNQKSSTSTNTRFRTSQRPNYWYGHWSKPRRTGISNNPSEHSREGLFNSSNHYAYNQHNIAYTSE